MQEDQEEEEKPYLWLPQEIIHHILYYLNPKKRAQSSTISKDWLYACRTNPRLDFDDSFFNVNKGYNLQERFGDYVNNTLANFQGPNIKEFHLSMVMMPGDDAISSSSVDQWVYFAMKKKVQVLHITLPELDSNSYKLPSKILGFEYLTKLHVNRCKFPNPNFNHGSLTLWKNLRVLHLISVYNLSTEILDWLISVCPLIHDLKISDHYDELDQIRVFDLPSLRMLWIEEGYSSETRLIEVMNVPDLETMVVELGFGRCTLTLHPCPNLKSLSLKNANLKDEFFETLTDKFPTLECLELTGCFGFKKKTFPTRHHKLKVLRISESWDDDG
ncbi:OLC1v1020381C1 [Oldenlandia corymbosa var. corymbosa]|uniref:OLC1v1020381C1 n=1 Tax=Oldenlandia corymbosa var. corymbosa TaxID=529605 RepID=A0AAV1EGT6_OLDCO|nr:OLC1v1020381C1 [Oldenlandia corymbosa var. corymbosa]